MNKTTNKYTPEVRERAVRMVLNGEVLWGACALKLGDEPFTSAVEDGAMQHWMSLPDFCIALHNLVHREIRKQPA